MNSNEYTWDPWIGCMPVSEGCKNCYILEKSCSNYNRYGCVTKFNKADFYSPVKKTRVFNHGQGKYVNEYKIKSGSTIRVCNKSDFFIEYADYYRKRAWKIIRERKDCMFIITTKLPHRFYETLPDDWFNGWNNVTVYTSVENQAQANKRLDTLIELPIKHLGIEIAPILEYIDIRYYLSSGKIESVIVRGETGNSPNIRECNFEHVRFIEEQCKLFDIDFHFEATGSVLIKDNKKVRVGKNDERGLAEHLNVDNDNKAFIWENMQKLIEEDERIEMAAKIYKMYNSKDT